ncbi:MAG: arylsulfatase [Opitutus sp.]|nr:arylsulfatase [Opitutus sp.]
MKRLLALLLLAPSALLLAAASPSAPRPNIVIILVDDMGFSDIGCYGGEIPTPNIDALAKGGVRFTQFYNTGRCCPTRASLLTGLYSHQAGVGHMVNPRTGADGAVLPGYAGRLNDRCVTFAEVVHSAGYFTAMTGKWHVGQALGVTPWGRGFDRSLNAAAGGFYYPGSERAKLFLNGRDVGGGGEGGVPPEWYSTDLWTDYGLRFIDEARAEKKPFLLYLAHNAPHFPLQAPADEIARFRGKFMDGWDKLREARYARQIAAGLIDQSWPLAPRPPNVPAWSSLSRVEQERYDHMMAIFAAALAHVDTAIGRLVAGLRERGELDNTLILFLSDNGGNAESGVPGRFNGASPGDAQSTVYVGECWAFLENTPFRRYKHYNHEGGIATPLIAHWPAAIPAARRGALEAQPGHLVDLMATCVDLAGANYPTTFKGQPIHPMEGVSLRPALTGAPLARTAPIFFEHEGNAAIRRGDDKLVRLGGEGAWELYNLKTDRTEQHNLAAAQPARARELAALWESWASRANVLPVMVRGGASEAPSDPSASPAAKKGRKKQKAANEKL